MRPAIDAWALDLPDSLSEGLPQLRLKINFERDMDWSFQRDLGSADRGPRPAHSVLREQKGRAPT